MTWKNKLRNKSRRKELFMAYGQILLGCIIGGAAYPMFLVPNNIAPGGLTGVATVLNYLVQVPVGLTSMLMECAAVHHRLQGHGAGVCAAQPGGHGAFFHGH